MTHRLRCKTAVQLATALLLLGQGAANAWEQEPARSPAGLLSSHRGQLAQAPTRFSPSAIDRLESPYVLGPGDQLQIALFQLPQYSGEHEIQVDGSLNLPLVGQIDVTGLTLDQATAAISNAYSRILKRPIVNLSLVQRRPLTVGIAGEIQRPGSYTLAPANQSFPSLTDLLTTAGGITQSADLRQVQVQRQEGSATRTISVNLWQLLEKGDSRYNISLRDGDSIFIPSTLVPLEQDRLLADASFYADRSIPIDVAVVGEVFRPGPYTVRGGFTRTGEAGEPGGGNDD
jgi:polysaccharide export outer membrane protein